MIILASCRRHLFDATAYPVPMDMPSGDFAGKRVLILVHGYRTDYESIVASYDTIERRIGHCYDKVIGFVWPGGWTRVGYQVSKRRADRSAVELRQLIGHLAWQGAVAIDIQAHSLGAHVALECLNHSRLIRGLYLAAPAVHHDCLEFGRFFEAHFNSLRIHILHSSNDPVLGWWYRIGTLGHKALGHRGAADVERLPANVVQVDCSSVIHGHSEYRHSAAVYAYWEKSVGGAETQQFVKLEAA